MSYKKDMQLTNSGPIMFDFVTLKHVEKKKGL